MYLKELTLRGFKSFASSTTLRFEPGITAVVGPNGSGKSNIVDALTWVMGEQGVKNLRGTSMQDVIFAGTASRPPLGRAQVSLTIDNTDHTLDIDYAEVNISRTLFRDGTSQYAINGAECRLLDVQELLSDTGLGQQMHVIVGQGRLDSILHADPHGHRAFIEEAAGILKHRKRKERALRKLENTEANLSRLDDLLGEIHKQLGPLGRQARISRRAAAIQVSLRDAQARVYADDADKLASRRSRLVQELDDARSELEAAQAALVRVKERIEVLESNGSRTNPVVAKANMVWRDNAQIEERLKSLALLASERARAARETLSRVQAEDSDMLEHRAQELDQQRGVQEARASDLRLALDKAVEQRAEAERHLASMRQTMTELRRSEKEHDAQVATLHEMLTKQQAAAQIDEGRLADLTARRDALHQELTEQTRQVQEWEHTAQQGWHEQGTALADARGAVHEARELLEGLEEDRRHGAAQIASLQARADAIQGTLDAQTDPNGSLEAERSHLLGRLADFIVVSDGWQDAVSRALDLFANSRVVADEDTMVGMLGRIVDHHEGSLALIHPLHTHEADPADRHALARCIDPNSSCERPELAADIAQAVRAILAGCAAAGTVHEAIDLIRTGEWRMAVTREGVVVNAAGAVGGSRAAQSDLSLAARRDKALEQLTALQREQESVTAQIEDAASRHDELRKSLDDLVTKQTEDQVRRDHARRSLEDARSRMDNLRRSLTEVGEQLSHTTEHREAALQKIDDLHMAWESASKAGIGESDGDDMAARQRALEQTLDVARDNEVRAKVAWGQADAAVRSLERQAGLLHDNAVAAVRRHARIEAQNRHRNEVASRAERLASDAEALAGIVHSLVVQVDRQREQIQQQTAGDDKRLVALRAERDALEPQAAAAQQHVHELDVQRERLAAESGQLEQKVTDALALNLDELLAQYAPDREVPVVDEHGGIVPVDDDHPDVPATVPYVRSEQIARLEQARRDLVALGKVNPLATEEYDALQERNAYLVGQRDDVAKGRQDLLDLITEIDGTMLHVFESAFHDTAAAFASVFATLFPGGTGRLRLEDPDHPLTSGVLVEASPAGKKVRQLSLLSGGERSLTALALLFAIFTARPSPFYVMDEVEAALDDVNLTRLLNAFNALREHAQLIVITHQQRTMGIADALYGVTMRSDGVTAVVSQKLDRA